MRNACCSSAASIVSLLGGESDHTLRRVVEFGNGWLPRAHRGFQPDRAVARLRQAAAAGGRDPTAFSITVFNAPTDEAVLASREVGIHRVLLEAPDRGRDEVLRVLDRNAALVSVLT
jgi:alkanesulfonate monooxygenase SsuD/methylene tetrahydromethanopterin reductase-like flavin-dependent oxidoreductase (luciferase family)